MSAVDRLAQLEHLVAVLSVKARRVHETCEDSWYSCPLSPEGCANDGKTPGVCDCGADAWNAELDALLAQAPAPMLARRPTLDAKGVVEMLDGILDHLCEIDLPDSGPIKLKESEEEHLREVWRIAFGRDYFGDERRPG